MRLDTEIHSSKGIVECTLIRTHYDGADCVEVELWQGSPKENSLLTIFAATVHMKWDGERYKIVRRIAANYTHPYWLELENLISNTIVVNE